MRALLEHSGKAKRGSELFETRNPLSFTKKLFKGLKVSTSRDYHVILTTPTQDVENVYTRHKPLLADLLDQLAKDRLSDTLYPYCGGDHPRWVVSGCMPYCSRKIWQSKYFAICRQKVFGGKIFGDYCKRDPFDQSCACFWQVYFGNINTKLPIQQINLCQIFLLYGNHRGLSLNWIISSGPSLRI